MPSSPRRNTTDHRLYAGGARDRHERLGRTYWPDQHDRSRGWQCRVRLRRAGRNAHRVGRQREADHADQRAVGGADDGGRLGTTADRSSWNKLQDALKADATMFTGRTTGFDTFRSRFGVADRAFLLPAYSMSNGSTAATPISSWRTGSSPASISRSPDARTSSSTPRRSGRGHVHHDAVGDLDGRARCDRDPAATRARSTS